MPKENKHARGRRGERKGKRKRNEDENSKHNFKRRGSTKPEEIQFYGTDNSEFQGHEAQEPTSTERPFFGLLDDEEQEYFRRADELLEVNDFPSTEERSFFLANVYREAEGKELKIANSQSCSRLMERLILLSTPDQKKKLLEKFSGHFLHLVQHRFASHCCETLFIESAPIVTQELTGEVVRTEAEDEDVGNGDSVLASMENLFLHTLNELEGHMGFLLTDRFASHAVRVLLVVLSGRPLTKSSTMSLLQSKKKEKIGITGLDASPTELSLQKRAVPESFQFAISKIISDIVTGLDTSFIHVLATHPTGNPTLQLLLELELTQQAMRKTSPNTPSIIQKLLPDDITTPDSQSASFINGLMYEPIGSRLLETIVTFAPGKMFKQVYRFIFKERIGSLARNEISGYVVVKVLERLSKADLEEAVILILPQVSGLIERSRTTVIKTLFERCQARGANESIKSLTSAVNEAYSSDPSTLLLKITHFTPPISTTEPAATASSKAPQIDPSTLHGSLLAQTMLSVPGPPTVLLQSSLLALPPTTLLHLATTTSTSHILQSALIPTPSNLPFRRKLINQFLLEEEIKKEATNDLSNPETSLIITLALSKPGSHVLDALYTGTASLMMLKERICATLLAHAALLRDDFVGRVVLRNWMVELFGRHRAEWVRRVRAAEENSSLTPSAPLLTSSSGGITENAGSVPRSKRPGAADAARQQLIKGGWSGKEASGRAGVQMKTAIQLARERFAARILKKEGGRRSGRLIGANAN